MTLKVVLPQNDLLTSIEVYNHDGLKLISEITNSLNCKIDVNALTKGTYMLRVFNREKTLTTKFVRQ